MSTESSLDTVFEPPAEVIYESDIDWAAEIAAADERAEEDRQYAIEARDCCGGTCGSHWLQPVAAPRQRYPYDED